jgi:hypothetical protein
MIFVFSVVTNTWTLTSVPFLLRARGVPLYAAPGRLHSVPVSRVNGHPRFKVPGAGQLTPREAEVLEDRFLADTELHTQAVCRERYCRSSPARYVLHAVYLPINFRSDQPVLHRNPEVMGVQSI